ncbi:efflux RND transporter permease subunit [Suttonella sp. R2A3]|uniref:efflux RND transporter permease subunit n=1 Tax=Suttonella sp. R2A3 TaxID=2908648 RepID=UPI001F437E53|nr:efflux RND transporter permease subunit [Suttonella sp. R2A3]UJF24764.1 efflux RND transporter permease subunit [Suttonella sp. R2A3]
MNFSAYSIRNPLVAIVLFVLLTVGGWLGFERMKVQQFPDMDFPVVVVTVIMPGTSPEQLETDVAKVIEDQVSGIEGIKRIYTTVQNGAVTLVIEFRLGYDIQTVLDEVRSSVNEIRGDLPADAEEPIISKVGTSGFPIVTYTIASDSLSIGELSWYVDDEISKLLSGINGVGSIVRVGGLEREIHVDVDPLALSAAGASINDVSNQLNYVQQDAPGGEASIGENKQPIRALGGVTNVDDLANLYLPIGQGANVRLSSIAEVSDAYAEQSSIAMLDGEPVVAFEITRSRGSSEVEVAKRVDEALADLMQMQLHLSFERVYDLATPVEQDYQASLKMLIEGGLLAVVVVFLFLRNIRATLIAAVALPLSIIPTFIGMYLLGFSLNLISLLALSLVVGILVDDAIVEIENIMRHLRMGKTPYDAAMQAADEIGLAVIATTFTLIAVFLPTAFMSGVVGQFFKQFGWTASIAIFASLLVARLLTPMMAAYLIKPEKPREYKESALMGAYLRLADWAIRWRWLTLALTIVLFVGSLALARLLPSDFLPADDLSQSRVEIELAPGATIEETLEVSEWTRRAVMDIDGIESVYSSVGHMQAGMDGPSNAGAHGSTRKAALNLVLSPRSERINKTAIEAKIRERLQSIPGARFKVGLNNGGESGYKVSLTGEDWPLLRRTARQLMNEIRDIPGVSNVRSNEGIAREELQIIPDTTAMAAHGVSTAALAQTIRVATMGDYAQLLSKLNVDKRRIPILLRLAPEYRGDIATLENLLVRTNQGPVRLGDVARLHFGSSPSAINRFERSREISIQVENNEGELGALVKAVKNTPTMQQLPAGVKTTDLGQAGDMAELFNGFKIAMMVGVLCIFGVLVLLFHRILHPFTILMALPLSVGGAFVGLLLSGAGLSMPSLIGLVMLMGIATKNSILLVDYAIIAEQKGKVRREALLDACRKRARPIIMTTIAMGAGMLPLIFGWGEVDSSFRRPMAIAVFGGLITSTMLSLIVIPTFYTFMDDLAQFVKRLWGKGSHKEVSQ